MAAAGPMAIYYAIQDIDVSGLIAHALLRHVERPPIRAAPNGAKAGEGVCDEARRND